MAGRATRSWLVLRRSARLSEGALRVLAQYLDWRAQEARLNEYPQFTTTVDGANLHFYHVRSPRPDAFPLLLAHGFPGSVVEFLQVLGPLTDPAAYGGDGRDAFHVVCPSIPGYGFSGPTVATGWHPYRVGQAFATLIGRARLRTLRRARH